MPYPWLTAWDMAKSEIKLINRLNLLLLIDMKSYPIGCTAISYSLITTQALFGRIIEIQHHFDIEIPIL